jgi:hypothetical protein
MFIFFQNKIPLTYVYFLFPFYFNPLVFLLLSFNSSHIINHIFFTGPAHSIHRLVHPPHRLVPASSMAPRIRSTNSSAPSASPGLADGSVASASSDAVRRAARKGSAGATARSMCARRARAATACDWRWEVDGEELDMSSARLSPVASMCTSASAAAARTETMAAREARSSGPWRLYWTEKVVV